MKTKIITLLLFLSMLSPVRSFALSYDVNFYTRKYIVDNDWANGKLMFVASYLAASETPGPLIPLSYITGVESDDVTLTGTNVSESSSSPIIGSSDLTFTGSPDFYMDSTSPSFSDAYCPVDLFSDTAVTAAYKYYYDVNGSGEIFVNTDVSWSGFFDGWFPPDGGREDQEDSEDSGYLSIDTGINVSSLPGYGGGGS